MVYIYIYIHEYNNETMNMEPIYIKQIDMVMSSLFYACNSENERVVKYLVEHGADINNGKTSLFGTCQNGNENIVRYLIEHRANINKASEDGMTQLSVIHFRNKKNKAIFN